MRLNQKGAAAVEGARDRIFGVGTLEGGFESTAGGGVGTLSFAFSAASSAASSSWIDLFCSSSINEAGTERLR